MSNDMLSGLGDSQDSSEESDEPDWLPSGFTNLGGGDFNQEESDRLNPSIRPNKIYSEFHENLESGWGRDKLVQYIDKNLDSYGPEETIDLKMYILDRLDSSRGHREGELLGDDVFETLTDFKEAEGNPDFLESYEVNLDY